MKRAGTAALFILPWTFLVLCGCPWSPPDKPPLPPPEEYLPQSSAVNCLENLKTAYVRRNFDEYEKLFSTDFTFQFNPRDIGGQDPTPAFWGLAEEKEAAEGLFSNEVVDQIELDYALDPMENSDDEKPGTWKILAKNIRLTIHTRNPDGEAVQLQVPGDVNTFYFKEYPEETASDGRTLWRIYWWNDEPIEGLAGSLAQNQKR